MPTMTALLRHCSGTGRTLWASTVLCLAIGLPAIAGGSAPPKLGPLTSGPPDVAREPVAQDALVAATHAARMQAARACAGDGECGAERPTESASEAVRLIASLAIGASESSWSNARIDSALTDLAVGASFAGREELGRWSAYIAALAPNSAHEAALLEAAVRIVEPVLLAGRDDAQKAPARAGQSGAVLPETELLELAADLEGWVRRLDALARKDSSAQIRERFENFAYGGVAPRFAARDTAGNEVRSIDFTGKVVVYRFWSNDSPASIVAHEGDAAMFRSYWDAPFELVGVSSDDDREYHVSTLYEHDFGGTQVFDGPISTDLVDALAKSGQTSLATTAPSGSVTSAWHNPPPGSLFVIDAQGVIRGRDLAGQELHDLIDALIAEHHLRVRELQLTRSLPITSARIRCLYRRFELFPPHERAALSPPRIHVRSIPDHVAGPRAESSFARTSPLAGARRRGARPLRGLPRAQ